MIKVPTKTAQLVASKKIENVTLSPFNLRGAFRFLQLSLWFLILIFLHASVLKYLRSINNSNSEMAADTNAAFHLRI